MKTASYVLPVIQGKKLKLYRCDPDGRARQWVDGKWIVSILYNKELYRIPFIKHI